MVSGQRGIMGIQVDRVITEDEVSTYGLSSIDELLDEIASERGKGREETVYLIDGKRVLTLRFLATNDCICRLSVVR